MWALSVVHIIVYSMPPINIAKPIIAAVIAIEDTSLIIAFSLLFIVRSPLCVVVGRAYALSQSCRPAYLL